MKKKEKYEQMLPQLKALTEGVNNNTGALANAAALIHETMGFFWTGFYLVKDNILQLGPFQGPVACYTIPYGKGVCGTSWKEGKTLVVKDVEEFPGHIACSSLSRSEIVVPILKASKIIGVLDIDSKEIATFDNTDKDYLEEAMKILSDNLI
ncbi:MAG: GAF domain-containing protein [Bacteroidales bacterium]|jgi:GAF domain-containing protein|nr:GAF domain-containing protein [Bacteroidales bacterium]